MTSQRRPSPCAWKRWQNEKDANIGDLLRDLLERYGNDGENNARRNSRATGADFARNALAAGLASAQPVDTADRSREILNTEFADYLKRRANR